MKFFTTIIVISLLSAIDSKPLLPFSLKQPFTRGGAVNTINAETPTPKKCFGEDSPVKQVNIPEVRMERWCGIRYAVTRV